MVIGTEKVFFFFNGIAASSHSIVKVAHPSSGCSGFHQTWSQWEIFRIQYMEVRKRTTLLAIVCWGYSDIP